MTFTDYYQTDNSKLQKCILIVSTMQIWLNNSSLLGSGLSFKYALSQFNTPRERGAGRGLPFAENTVNVSQKISFLEFIHYVILFR